MIMSSVYDNDTIYEESFKYIPFEEEFSAYFPYYNKSEPILLNIILNNWAENIKNN